MAWSGFRKKKEGPQQGTLFDVREVPSQPVNSPGMQKRGRRQEMLSAMPPDTTTGRGPEYQQILEKVKRRDPLDAFERADLASENKRRADLSRQFADETTIPPSDLGGLDALRTGIQLQPGVRGAYRDRRIMTSEDRPDSGVLTHELGHHVSIYHEQNQVGAHGDVAGLKSGSTISPGEEGRADAYALQHAPEARRGHTYANLVKGLSSTKYVSERESRGQPLDEDERKDQGLPLEFGDPGNYQLGMRLPPGRR